MSLRCTLALIALFGCSSDDARGALEPYPLESLECRGRDFTGPGPGYHGRCCPQAHCYTPASGACAAAQDTGELVAHPRGVGSCGCSISEDGAGSAAVMGPFAPNPAHPPATPGECCYVIGFIQCD